LKASLTLWRVVAKRFFATVGENPTRSVFSSRSWFVCLHFLRHGADALKGSRYTNKGYHTLECVLLHWYDALLK